MEILAPSGNREALERAEAAGADAVYLGYSAFSARAGAGNFDRDSLRDAIRFAHLHHMRVYVTVNTLVKDSELQTVLDVLRMLCELKADGVLVQDAGVLKMARECCPGLKIHASTQMAIHNRTGVRFCGKAGMRRVVLARECSLDEIRKCTGAGPEIEVFGHGAQCVAVSGMCLFSSMVGERSGNRGRCAQPCRMEYTFRDRKGAWLSPRDVCLLEDISELEKAGVASLKLEGRLKRPEYVGVVTDCYRRAADGQGRDSDMKSLRQIFNRGGFMRGYAMGCRDAAVISPARVDHEGIPVGRVESAGRGMAKVRLNEDLHDGDGLQIRSYGKTYDLIYSGKDTPAGATATVRLRSGIQATADDEVARLTDARQMEEIRALPEHRIRVKMTLTAMPGQPLKLSVTDGISTVTAEGEIVSTAQNRAATEDELRRNAEKTGGTPFAVYKTDVYTENAFVPVSMLNAVRREALALLTEERIRAFEPDNGETSGLLPEVMKAQSRIADMVICRDPAELTRIAEEEMIPAIYPEDWREDQLTALLNTVPEGTWLQLPPACEEDTLQMILRVVTAFKDRLGGVIPDSIGQLGIEWPVSTGAGEGIPVMNKLAASFLLEHGCRFVTASPELTGKELKELLDSGLPIRVPAWGRTRLMILHHCPARTWLGLKSGRENCTMCDTDDGNALRGKTLTDRLGHSFPLERVRLPEGCLVQLMNTCPTDLLDRTADMPVLMRMDSQGIPDETGIVLRSRREGKKTGLPCTSGHWSRPVE